MVLCGSGRVKGVPLSGGARKVFGVESWLSFVEKLRERLSHVRCRPPFRMLIMG